MHVGENDRHRAPAAGAHSLEVHAQLVQVQVDQHLAVRIDALTGLDDLL